VILDKWYIAMFKRRTVLSSVAFIALFGCDRPPSQRPTTNPIRRAPTTAATQDVGKYEVHVFVTVNPPTTNQIHTEDLESLKKEVLDQAIRELSTRPSSFGAADSK
jgi:hypothetical protein